MTSGKYLLRKNCSKLKDLNIFLTLWQEKGIVEVLLMVLMEQAKAEALLRKNNLPFPKTAIIRSEKDIPQALKKTGLPAVFKIYSPQIIHKLESGTVIMGISNIEAGVKAYNSMMNTVKKRMKKTKIKGVLCQEQVSGTEVIIGMKRDKNFGPVIVFGAGGTHAELLKDSAMMISPLTKALAEELMIKTNIGKALLKEGSRAAIAFSKLSTILIKLSALAMSSKTIDQIDFNPVIILGERVTIVDAKIMIDEKGGRG